MGHLFPGPWCAGLLTAVAAAWLPLCAVAQTVTPAASPAATGEAAAKARLAVAFVRQVQWPAGTLAQADEPLRVCVAQDSRRVADAFSTIEGEVVNGHPLALQFKPGAGTSACHVLFVDDSAGRAWQQSWRVPPTGTLTIGAQDGFLSQGGIVELVRINDNLRFDIRLSALRSAGLQVRPGVLKLAREVLP